MVGLSCVSCSPRVGLGWLGGLALGALLDRRLGLVVDDISEVIQVSANDVTPVPDSVVDDRARCCIEGLIRSQNGGLVIQLDPQRILTHTQQQRLRELDSSPPAAEARHAAH